MGDGAHGTARSDDDDTVGASKGSRHGRRRRRVATGVFAGIAVRVSKSSTAGTLVTGPSGATCDFKVNGDCQGMNLDGVVVRGVDLTGMKFNGSSLNGADFTASTFTNTDLTDATFIGAILDGVKSGGVIGKKSLKTSFPSYLKSPTKYDYEYVYNFITAQEWLTYVQYGFYVNQFYPEETQNMALVEKRKVWLPAEWQLVNGYLVGPKANLSGVQFSNSDLSFQNLSNADLKGANLFDANIDLANVAGADLRGAAYPYKGWVEGKTYCESYCWWNRVSNFAGAIVDVGSQMSQPGYVYWDIAWTYSQQNSSAPPKTMSALCKVRTDFNGSTFTLCN
jgi:uncharacterized protein YjbI with pentapeptide repeats